MISLQPHLYISHQRQYLQHNLVGWRNDLPLGVLLAFLANLSEGGKNMGVLIVDVEKDIDSAFRKIVEKRFGRGEHVVEAALNAVMRDWVERQSSVAKLS